MKTLKLRALKPHKYGTRHLTAGEEYEAPFRQAVALMATRKAKAIKGEKRAVAKPPAPSEPQAVPAAVVPEPDHETTNHAIDRLRLEATQLGINIDGRWGVARLQHEIAQRRG